MEHNPYDVHAEFWRDTYLTALKAGHEDPAAAADEAFLAFDSRFGEVEPAASEMATVDGMRPVATTTGWVSRFPELPTLDSIADAVSAIEKEIAENADNEFIPHHGWARKTDAETPTAIDAEAWAAAGYGTVRDVQKPDDGVLG